MYGKMPLLRPPEIKIISPWRPYLPDLNYFISFSASGITLIQDLLWHCPKGVLKITPEPSQDELNIGVLLYYSIFISEMHISQTIHVLVLHTMPVTSETVASPSHQAMLLFPCIRQPTFVYVRVFTSACTRHRKCILPPSLKNKFWSGPIYPFSQMQKESTLRALWWY